MSGGSHRHYPVFIKNQTRRRWHGQLLESPGHVTPLCSISGPDWIGAHEGVWRVFGSLSSTKQRRLPSLIMSCARLLGDYSSAVVTVCVEGLVVVDDRGFP